MLPGWFLACAFKLANIHTVFWPFTSPLSDFQEFRSLKVLSYWISGCNEKRHRIPKHTKNGWSSLAAMGILFFCVVSIKTISTVCHHILRLSWRALLPAIGNYLSVCCVKKQLAEKRGLSRRVKRAISHGQDQESSPLVLALYISRPVLKGKHVITKSMISWHWPYK